MKPTNLSKRKPGPVIPRCTIFAPLVKKAAAIEKTFTAVQLMRMLDKLDFIYEPEEVYESLVRLELAFIFKQEKQEYSYAVPLFKKMILDRDPEETLTRELRSV